MKLRDLFFIILLIVMACSCQSNPKRDKEKISILRYDIAQSEYIKFNSFSSLQKLNMEYPLLTKILVEDVLELGLISDDVYSLKLRSYFSDSTLLQLTTDVEEYFTTLDETEEKLSSAFIILRDLLPWIKVPTIYTQISAFNESVIVSDTIMGISLDKYMGQDYPLYERFYSRQQLHTMEKNRIPVDCIISFLVSLSPPKFDHNSTLLDIMVQMGKIYYLAQTALQMKSAGDCIAYSSANNEWCNEHEKDIWAYINEENHLESKDVNVVYNYIEPTQRTKILNQEVEPLLGVWVGIQIANAYISNNPDADISSFLLERDSQKILKESGYMQEEI